MFLLFGFGKRTVKDYGAKEVIHCQRCNNAKQWQYKQTRTWFTLFFVPVIPYKTTYSRVCPICGNSEQLTKDEFSGIVEEVQIIEGKTKSEDSQYAGMTETQANYMKEMAAIKIEKARANETKESLESVKDSE